MAKAVKTNVLRHLDAAKIPYETREYAVEDDNFDGKLVAGKTGTFTAAVYPLEKADQGLRENHHQSHRRLGQILFLHHQGHQRPRSA